MKHKIAIKRSVAALFLSIVAFGTHNAHAASSNNNEWEKIMEGIHMNERVDKSFGDLAGGRFSAGAYLDIDALPPYGKAGVYANASVFLKDIVTWNILKAEGFVEGGLKISTRHDAETDELVLTFMAGADAVVDLDFLEKQIYYFNANEELANNGNQPIKQTWEMRFDISALNPMLEATGAALGIGKKGAFDLLAEAVTDSIKVLIRSNIQEDGRELTVDEKLRSLGKIVAKVLYKIAINNVSNSTRSDLDRLVKAGYSYDEILDAMIDGNGTGELSRVNTKQQIAAVREIYNAVITLIDFSYKDGADGVKVGFGKDYKWEKSLPAFKQTYVIGIIPVTVEFGGSAAIGARWEAGLELASKDNGGNNLYMQVGPYVSAGAFGAASLDALIARAGISGSIDLIRDDLTLTLRAPFPRVWTGLQGTIDNNLSTANGNISAFIAWSEPTIVMTNVRIPMIGWRPWTFYTYYVTVTVPSLSVVDKKESVTLISVQGPSWTTSIPLFSFGYTPTPAINAYSGGEFSTDLLAL
ncbi:MAG: hypothetical protein JXR76_16660 [Deltaproteobacteria bacterium]|nr:hypothetical protein [Deltaproteobacteria bacterium]